jgi:hypothetical protein
VTLFHLIAMLVVVGVALWVLAQPWVPIEGTFKAIIRTILLVVCAVVTIFWLLSFFGVADTTSWGSRTREPTIRAH